MSGVEITQAARIEPLIFASMHKEFEWRYALAHQITAQGEGE